MLMLTDEDLAQRTILEQELARHGQWHPVLGRLALGELHRLVIRARNPERS